MNTVTSCTKGKDWVKDGKAIATYEVTLSDGRTGKAYAKEIPPGTPESDLEITEGPSGLKIKLNKPKNGFQSYSKGASNESVSLSYAKDVACAHIAAGKDFKSEDIIKVAEVFFNWLEKKKL